MINPTIFTICKIILLSIANMFTRKNYKWSKILISNIKNIIVLNIQLYMVKIDRIIIIRQWSILWLRHTSSVKAVQLSAKTKLFWTNLSPFLAQQVQGPTATSLILPQRLFAPMFPYSKVPLFLNLVLYLFETPDIDSRSLCCFRFTSLLFDIFKADLTTIWYNIKLLWSFC